MKKLEQLRINELSMDAYNEAMRELDNNLHNGFRRLRTCTAEVTETPNYYILRSYNTYVAVIDKTTDTLYDVLRLVYGYTPTSSQHISKFGKDYGQGKWGCANTFTAR